MREIGGWRQAELVDRLERGAVMFILVIFIELMLVKEALAAVTETSENKSLKLWTGHGKFVKACIVIIMIGNFAKS